jgi:hypothetical protein
MVQETSLMEDVHVRNERNHRLGFRNGRIALALILLSLVAVVAACSGDSSDSDGCKTGIIETTSGRVCGKVTAAADLIASLGWWQSKGV